MRKYIIIFFELVVVAVFLFPLAARSQSPVVQAPIRSDVSIPLRDMKPPKRHFWDRWRRENDLEVPNKFRPVPPGFNPDGALQTEYHPSSAASATLPLVNFNGTGNAANAGRVTPPDPAGDVGLNHYVQVVNSQLQIFSKTGTSLYGPVTTSTLWSGFTGNWTGHNNGDAIVLYDENADRWIISQFAIDCPGTPYTEYEMVAVSTTGDPTGSYYRYAFAFDYMPDYPKLGVWRDGYYMAVNRFNTNASGTPYIGAAGCVMDRSKMLTGDPSATMVYFKTETLGGSGSAAGGSCYSMLPTDCDGTFAAAGTPDYFTYIDGSAELRIWALHADWTTPANGTFTYVTALPVAAYTQMGSASVPEMGALSLDGLGDRLMFRNQYRNFGSYETFVTCHSVNTGGFVAGVRWYEYRKTGSTFAMYQQSTFSPDDGRSRWMASIAMNAAGDIGMAYSVSSSTMYPSIWYTGRKAGDPLNQMTMPEGVIQTGTVSMNSYSRWGDYTAMNVDPTDNATFWTTQEYVGTYGGWCPWATKIASFKIVIPPVVSTTAATNVAGTSATLNGTVNPNGLSTNYNFEWGTTTGYGNSTTVTAAGSGYTAVNATANLTGLVPGTTYHYRLDATNSDGISNGGDVTFVPGFATVNTTAVTSITSNSAVSGGTVTADGGNAVSARGVCWAATINPVATGSHTTDGTGTGTYTSTITGLTANTTYHERAYATNALGTNYGSDLQFSTICNKYVLPFSEGFANTTIPDCWSQVDHNGNNQVWQFGTINYSSPPAPVLTLNYAYLNSDAYGNGSSQNADLVSPVLDLSAYSSVTLQFSHHFQQYTSSTASLYYSINSGNTWTLIQQWTATTTNPALFSQAIPAVAGQPNVKFKWNYTGFWDYWWAIDNISVSCTSSLPVSVSVLPSATTVCAGTTVSFTASPVNGGAAPAYQWKVNGSAVTGGTNATYAYIPANGDLVTCMVTSSAGCVTGNPATSSAITMTVNPLLSANFIADKLTPQKNETVQLTDLTTGGPTSWSWSFDRPTFVFVNGTTAATQNPRVQFTDGGPYAVTLQAGSPGCSNISTKTAYLRAGISGLWTGNTSSDWNTLTNWDNWLSPGGGTDVVIPAAAANWPVYSGNLVIGTTIHNLTLTGTTSRITVTGNLVLP